MSGRLHVGSGAGVGADPGEAVEAALASMLHGLDGRPPDAVCAFVGAAYAEACPRIAEALASASQSASVGVTAQGVVADSAELERPDAIAVWGLAGEGIEATTLRFDAPADGGVEWPALPASAHALLLVADPFSFPPDAFLAWSAQARPHLPVVGGLASGGMRPGVNRLLIDGEVVDDGAVGLALGGAVRVRTLVSQGCRPIGEPLVVTGATRNLITELAGDQPMQRLRALYGGAPEDDRRLMEAGLHLGLVIDEYADTHDRGGFLIRAVLGADEERGALAVGDEVRVGQTVQFHVRDADSADAELRALLDDLAETARPAGGLLFTCNGRGARLFGTPDHDARLVHDALGQAPLGGFFAAGELGPVGGRSFLHGFTASVIMLEEEM